MVLYDLETIKDLGLDRCPGCYVAPSDWVLTPPSQDYLTKILPTEILKIILLYAVRPEGGTQPIKADIITGRVRMAENRNSIPYRPNPTLIAHRAFTALSLTNRRLSKESTCLFFGSNRFYFHECIGMCLYLSKVAPEQREMIKEVIFVQSPYINSAVAHWAYELLSMCKLVKLSIAVPLGFFDWFDETTFGAISCLNGTEEFEKLYVYPNCRVKVFLACNYSEEVLDWKPAPLTSASSTRDEKQLSRMLKLWELSIMQSLGVKTESQATEGNDSQKTNENNSMAEARKRRLEDYKRRHIQLGVIKESKWDRAGGVKLCMNCTKTSKPPAFPV